MSALDDIIEAILRLRYEEGPAEYGPAICTKCKKAIVSNGQKQLGVLGTRKGIYFRCLIPCICGHRTGFVAITGAIDDSAA